MRLAYLDGQAGISGDMLLGACLQAGVPAEALRNALGALDLGATLKITEVDRSGIFSIKADILVDGEVAKLAGAESKETSETRPHANGSREEHLHEHAPRHGTSTVHEHPRRSLSVIRELIGRAELSAPVKARALRAFELLAEAEAAIHHVPADSIHFHEVGAIDAIADIVLVAVAAEYLQIEAWHCSSLNVGGGTIECAHGRFPVPAPATAELLRGAPTYSSGVTMELVTPTGAALLRALDCRFGPAPAMRVASIGYGAGSRNPEGFANVLRLSIGEAEEQESGKETIWVLEAAVDDLNPQIIGYVVERALALGALDVMCAAVSMKKNRPGTLITVLSDLEHRRVVEVRTFWGPVRVKVGSRDGVEFKAAPEFEDCRTIAETRNIPLKQVLETALRAYRELGRKP
jgi:uncharacterized protein (TIGR00299 family) protein